MRMGMRGAVSMGVCVIVLVFVVVSTAIVFAAAFIVRMAVCGAIGMAVRVGMLVLVVVTTAVVFATALCMLMRMGHAICMGVGMGVLRVAHDGLPLLNDCKMSHSIKTAALRDYSEQIMPLQSISYYRIPM